MDLFLSYHNPFRRANVGYQEKDRINNGMLRKKLEVISQKVEKIPGAVPYPRSFSFNHPFLMAAGVGAASLGYLKMAKLSPFPAGLVFAFSVSFFGDRSSFMHYQFWLKNYELLTPMTQNALRTGDHRYLDVDPAVLKL